MKRVIVNGQEPKATAANFAEWEVVARTAARIEVEARAEDAAGNVEKTPAKNGFEVTVGGLSVPRENAHAPNSAIVIAAAFRPRDLIGACPADWLSTSSED